ncbi:MAG: hypothetical protein ACRDXF_02915 [Acidimicrobiia bacterium]
MSWRSSSVDAGEKDPLPASGATPRNVASLLRGEMAAPRFAERRYGALAQGLADTYTPGVVAGVIISYG